MKEKKGMSLIGFTIVLAVLLIAAGAVIVYLLNNPVKEEVAIHNPASVQSNAANDKIIGGNNENPVSNIVVSVDVKEQNKEIKSDERYRIYINGLKNNLRKLDDSNNIIILGGEQFTLSKVGINSYIKIEKNGDAYLGLENEMAKKYGEKYKVATSIVNAGIQEYGQDASVILWFVNELGEFSYINISDYSTSKLEIKEIKDLKNIVYVTALYNGEANIPVAIDIDGNIIEINL